MPFTHGKGMKLERSLSKEEVKQFEIKEKEKYENESNYINELRENILDKRKVSKLSSVVSYKKRGHWGSNEFRGNTTGFLLIDLFNYYLPERKLPIKVFDPMEGSGTVGDVCKEVGNDVIEYEGRDLLKGFDFFEMNDREIKELRKKEIDFLFLHPPYWRMIEYWKKYGSKKESCLSGCKTYSDYLDKLFECILICTNSILPKDNESILAIQLGDYRKENKYYPIAMDIYYRIKLQSNLNLILKQIIIKVQNEYYKVGTEGSGIREFNVFGTPIISIQHEYVLIFQKV